MFSKVFLIMCLFLSALFLACSAKEQVEKVPARMTRVEATLVSDLPQYTPGDEAHFTFTVKNNEPQNRQLYIMSEREYYFEVYDPKGNLIWSDAEFKSGAGLDQFYLLAFAEKVYEATWNCRNQDGSLARLGTYMVKAYIPVAGNVVGFSDSLFIDIVD